MQITAIKYVMIRWRYVHGQKKSMNGFDYVSCGFAWSWTRGWRCHGVHGVHNVPPLFLSGPLGVQGIHRLGL